MRGAILLTACLSASGCLAYQNPSQADAPAVSTTAPYTLTVGALGSSNPVTVNARVQNINGSPLAGIPVMFSANVGTLSADSGITSASGMVTTTWSGNGSADVAARTGNLNAHTIVVSNTPVPTAPVPQVAFLNVSGSATTGIPVVFGVSSSATGQMWQWSFGDGGTAQTTAFNTIHTYTRAGLYTANVSSDGTVPTSATIAVTDAPAGPPPPALLAATITCVVSTTPVVPCNISATSNGAPLPSNSITNVSWDWGEGGGLNQITSSPVATHTYMNPGTYRIFATIVAGTPSGAAQTVTSTSVTVPKTP